MYQYMQKYTLTCWYTGTRFFRLLDAVEGGINSEVGQSRTKIHCPTCRQRKTLFDNPLKKKTLLLPTERTNHE